MATVRKPNSPYESRVIQIKRTAKVTGGGKKMSFQATVIAGDRKGKVGVGIAKGVDVPQAIEKATKKATSQLISLPIVRDTIPYNLFMKYKSVRLVLRPAKTGQGIIAGGPIKVFFELSGIKNITTKLVSKTKNKIAILKALVAACKHLALRYNTFYNNGNASHNSTQTQTQAKENSR